MIPVDATSATSPSGPSQASERAELRQAAEAFEAIFLRQILASARASSWADSEGPFSGSGLTQFTAMRDEHFAELASKGGGLGLADQIEAQLASMATQKETLS